MSYNNFVIEIWLTSTELIVLKFCTHLRELLFPLSNKCGFLNKNMTNQARPLSTGSASKVFFSLPISIYYINIHIHNTFTIFTTIPPKVYAERLNFFLVFYLNNLIWRSRNTLLKLYYILLYLKWIFLFLNVFFFIGLKIPNCIY